MDVTVLLEPTIDLPRLSEVLDGLGHEGRVHTIRGWSRQRKAQLFEAAKGHLPIDLDFVVPSGTAPSVEVIHEGHNSLPIFTHFQKRFAKVDDAIVGRNVQTMSPFTGPGLFVVRKGEADHEGELAFDYTTLPRSLPTDWPKLAPNEGGIPGIVFGGMIDHLRALSSHVSIGRAFKGGKPVDAWFALVRKDVS